MEILAVVVRYKVSLEESETICTIANNFSQYPELKEKFKILIWDNSPTALLEKDIVLPFEVIYKHSSINVGVSGAYNSALNYAEEHNCPWILLLDQDSSLPQDYLVTIYKYGMKLLDESRVAAVAPILINGQSPISPGQIKYYGVKVIKPPVEGVQRGEFYSANSGTLMRCASLRESGGFDEDFWLDLSDIVLFRKLHAIGKVLYIAGSLQVPHKVSLNDYDGSMSPQRYVNFITAEGAYWDIYRSFIENSIQTARLFVRAVKQKIVYKDKSYSSITLKYALKRLYRSRGRRVLDWKRSSLTRSMPLIERGKVVS